MCAYRLGTLNVHDEQAGSLALEGDGFAAAGEISTLVANPGVVKYLGLSDSEARQAQELVAAYRQALQDIGQSAQWTPPSLDTRAAPARTELAARVAQLLGPERDAALRRLSWRIRDGFALVDDDVASALELTPEQRAAVAEAARTAEHDNQAVLRSVAPRRLGTHQPIEDAGREATSTSSERLRAILTPEQQSRFERMKRGGS
jgi:hypothetical protein